MYDRVDDGKRDGDNVTDTQTDAGEHRRSLVQKRQNSARVNIGLVMNAWCGDGEYRVRANSLTLA